MDVVKKRKLLTIILFIMIIGVVVSTIGVITTGTQYTKSKQEYKKLESYVMIDSSSEKKSELVEEIPEESSEEPVMESMIDVDFDMDFASLKSINEDLIGWIYYEPLSLSYPVVIDKGDDYYEHYSFEKEKNLAGAIFLDYLSKTDFSGYNSIIYGHNMRNGTMFGSLNKLIDDSSIIEENPYFYVFTEKEALMYQIVSAYYTKANSATYDINIDAELEDQQAYVDYMDSVSVYRDEDFFSKEVTEDTKLCTLSTCHGLHSTSRTVIHGILVAREPR